MNQTRVLFIGRTLTRSLVTWAQRTHPTPAQIIHHATAKAALDNSEAATSPHLIIVRAEGRGTGQRVGSEADKRWPGVPLLLLCSKTASTALPLWASQVLYVPFSEDELLHAVERLLDSSLKPADTTGGMLHAGPFTLHRNERTLEIRRIHPLAKGGADGAKNGGAHERAFPHPTTTSTTYPLRPKEADLLAYLIEHEGDVVSREALMEHIWQTDYLGDTRTLNVHIRRLRTLLQSHPDTIHCLQTVRGTGYRLVLS